MQCHSSDPQALGVLILSLGLVCALLRRQMQHCYPELEFWMSEYCLFENNSEIKGEGRELNDMHAVWLWPTLDPDPIRSSAVSPVKCTW